MFLKTSSFSAKAPTKENVVYDLLQIQEIQMICWICETSQCSDIMPFNLIKYGTSLEQL